MFSKHRTTCTVKDLIADLIRTQAELLDGAAWSFKSAPRPRKASLDADVEMSVPSWAVPGAEVFAMGLHAGTRKRFRAVVTKIRPQFPRLVVKYTSSTLTRGMRLERLRGYSLQYAMEAQ